MSLDPDDESAVSPVECEWSVAKSLGQGQIHL